MATIKTTPIRTQYLNIKKNYPEAILFFRLGDFYETFDEDAKTTSKELNIVLTSRKVSKGQRIPMAGIPYHAADNYISKLINKGYHVAICEQIGEQPQKGLFPREVIRVVTPGTLIEPGMLKTEQNNFLLSVYQSENIVGLAYLDVSTGDSGVTEFSDNSIHNKLHAEISRISPAEIIHPESLLIEQQIHSHLTKLPDWKFEYSRCDQLIKQTYGISFLDGLGLRDKPIAVCALGGLLDYLNTTDSSIIDAHKNPYLYSIEDFMVLDMATRRNLELTKTLRGTNGTGSLLSVIDKTVTPMGKRRIFQWINQPLINIQAINDRLDSVQYFLDNGMLRIELRELLKKLSDIERIANRFVSMHAVPRDLLSLKDTLKLIPEIIGILKKSTLVIPPNNSSVENCKAELSLLESSISEDSPATLQHIGVIKNGYSSKLDDVITASQHARDWIADLEKREKDKHEIKSLKVGYNKVFGYYIEITNSYLSKTPEEYIRKQTLVNAERFITPELKEYESIVLNAEEEIKSIESHLFHELCKKLSRSINKFRKLANYISAIDVFISLAETAAVNNYCRPKLEKNTQIAISDGRHPVVEKTLQDNSFIANNTEIDQNSLIHIITGPNMSGKSTYLRQVALIVLLAQIGSFVPANSARIGLVDRIFTRIGAQDEIHAGQSTFMVEMVETANILNNASNRSLLILDEIGRGTSTYDGLSIAWSVIEFIHNHPKLKARTLFATHYHELTVLPDFLPQVSNFNVAVIESNREVVFLHKIVEGGTDKSYGIHVARLAGMPNPVLNRANDLLRQLEDNSAMPIKTNTKEQKDQPPLFEENTPLRDELSNLDIDSMSPIEALNFLYKWKNEYKK